MAKQNTARNPAPAPVAQPVTPVAQPVTVLVVQLGPNAANAKFKANSARGRYWAFVQGQVGQPVTAYIAAWQAAAPAIHGAGTTSPAKFVLGTHKVAETASGWLNWYANPKRGYLAVVPVLASSLPTA